MQRSLPRLAVGAVLLCTAVSWVFGASDIGLAATTSKTRSAHANAAFVGMPATVTGVVPSPILLYAQDWNAFPRSRSNALWQAAATTHQILVGSPGTMYGAMIPQLHAWNPQVKVLVYDLGPYTIKGSAEYDALMTQHPDYFARSAGGTLITVKAASGSPAFANNTLMDQSNPGWQAEEGQRIAANIAKYGFDGAYMDSMGPGVFSGTTTAVPMNPSTHQVYTRVEWMIAGGQEINAVKAAIGTKYLFSTGLVNGSSYQSYTHYLSDSNVDGVQTDSWLRVANSSASSWPAASTLAADLAMVLALQAKGKAFFGWTKVWTAATPAQTSAWNTYALAAYLLVDNGTNDYYTFCAPLNSDRTTVFYTNEVAALGAATDAFTLTNGIYTRNFVNGSVTLDTNKSAASITVVPTP